MLRALHAGHFHAAHGLAAGDLTLFSEGSLADNAKGY
jgi:hypothetical protein